MSKLGVFQVLDGGEVLVDEGGVRQRPEMFGGLQFRGIGREEQQMEVIRDPQAQAGMPPRPIKDQDDLLVGTGSDLAGELCQFHFKQGNADGGGQMKERSTRGRMDKANDGSARRSGAAPWLLAADQSAPRPVVGVVSSQCDAHRWPRLRRERWGMRWRPPGQAVSTFFEGVLLFSVGQGVLGPRHLLTLLEALQVVPAALGGDRTAQTGCHPVSDLAGPPVFRPVRSWTRERLA